MSSSEKDHYKIIYFDVRARAEPSRLILVYAGQNFEDKRVQADEFPALKPALPFGQLPVLEVDHGRFVLTQSVAIARYLAEKYGLAGQTEEEKARVNELVDWHKDIFNSVMNYPSIKSGFASEMDEKTAYEKAFLPGIKKNFPIYQKLVEESKSGFLVGSGLTFVDFFVSDFLLTVKQLEPKLLSQYSGLEKYIEQVHSLPQIKEYVEKRKYTIE
uniref:glutathione transferase n=1 Tax=Ditylenchus dipsaci TaxID=166011 RepID=A0A915EFE0_9BILA